MTGDLDNRKDRVMLRGSDLRLFESGETVNCPDLDHDQLLLLIHGFTAHGRYFDEMAATLTKYGYRVIYYNYNSYCGIELAARILYEQLEILDKKGNGVLADKGIRIIAHSMGGLVARSFIAMDDVERYVKGVITLGTPHMGTMTSKRLLWFFRKWAEHVSGDMLLPGFMTSQSAKELTGNDSDKLETSFLYRLRELTKSTKIPLISVSGGRKQLELVKFRPLNKLLNIQLQLLLSCDTNDGLVPEHSADIRCCVKGDNAPVAHFNAYAEYAVLNHSGLAANYQLGMRITDWFEASKQT